NETWVVPTLVVYKTFGLLNDVQFRSDDRMRYFGGEFRSWLDAKGDPRLKSWSTGDFRLERELYEQEKKIAGELLRGKVPMLAGTDAGNPYCFPGFSLHDELTLFVEAGMNPAAALRTATWNAAEFMNATDRYGSITAGKVADVVLLDADPLHDIRNITRISVVFESGREFDRGDLDAILKEAAQAPASHTDKAP